MVSGMCRDGAEPMRPSLNPLIKVIVAYLAWNWGDQWATEGLPPLIKALHTMGRR